MVTITFLSFSYGQEPHQRYHRTKGTEQMPPPKKKKKKKGAEATFTNPNTKKVIKLSYSNFKNVVLKS